MKEAQVIQVTKINVSVKRAHKNKLGSFSTNGAEVEVMACSSDETLKLDKVIPTLHKKIVNQLKKMEEVN